MWRRLGLVTALLLPLAACSSDDDDGGGGLPGGGGGGDGVEAMLDTLPVPSSVEEDGTLTVAYGDLARAARLAGVELPESPDAAAFDDQMDVISTITGQVLEDDSERTPVAVMPPEVAHVEEMVGLEEFVDDVGWSVFDVRSFVELQAPPNSVTVMDGGFDADRITESLGEPDDGVWIAGDPEVQSNLDERTPARPLGEPQWLSLDDDRLVITRSAEEMDAARGDGSATPTVADDEVMVSLAQAVDDADAYSALLYRGTLSLDFASSLGSPEQLAQACTEALQEPFTGVAGAIADDDGPVVVIAYVHESAEAAEANAETLQDLVAEGRSQQSGEPWSEQLELDSVETDGPVMTARLRPVRPGYAAIWHRLLLQRDNLVTHC